MSRKDELLHVAQRHAHGGLGVAGLDADRDDLIEDVESVNAACDPTCPESDRK